ncbi:hypothetical protein GGI25_000694 [Coemansia spiralis]|uniref:TEA domain-containing protein n=2 Tax=Coemansia TaxID=4863 RepID=A0A9W8L124_9FUNG|nr:TEA/ATTS domain family-domain-containing protein [Coemansia spiralis]KAJ1995718.1 hypothetical protein EDC05_000652 [Coemansia umbellata]KAJ2623678.1 hypothetical protein GGI26_002125 [Coemansia sp. RSA 1358]KAJ2680402.1 hypothetical protein GGI25_000694 [Coemansia spiralis]
MDIEDVCSIIADLDVESYHKASMQKQTADEVWPPEVEDAFLAAVQLFASVGQRKYQIEEKHPDGVSTELVGRNDIISRYIFMDTNKYRARKQVSSHIQVWVHCKKPPSNHDMSMAMFKEIQTVFRTHYSRPTTGFGQLKKKTRRVVSANSIGLTKSDKSIPSSDSLGIYKNMSSSLSGTKDKNSTATRKHSMPASLSTPSKRCRRVVSELHPSSFESFLKQESTKVLVAPPDFSNSSSVKNSHTTEKNNDYSSCTQPIWFEGCHESSLLGLPVGALGDPFATQNPMFLPQTPIAANPPSLASSSSIVANQPAAMCGISSTAPDSTSAIALTMATISTMQSYDELLSSPALQGGETMPYTNTLSGNAFETGIHAGVLPLSSGLALPASIDIISAFSAASGAATGASNDLMYGLGNPTIAAVDISSATAKATATANIPTICDSDALIDALSMYYSASSFENIQSVYLPQYPQDRAYVYGVADNWKQIESNIAGINKELTNVDVAATGSLGEYAHKSYAGPSGALLPEQQLTADMIGLQVPRDGVKAVSANQTTEQHQYVTVPSYALDMRTTDNKTITLDEVCARRSSAKGKRRPSKGTTSGLPNISSMRSSSKDSDMTAVACANGSPSPMPAGIDPRAISLGQYNSVTDSSASDAIPIPAAKVPEGSAVTEWINNLRDIVNSHSIIQSNCEMRNSSLDSSPLTRESSSSNNSNEWRSAFEHYLQGAS